MAVHGCARMAADLHLMLYSMVSDVSVTIYRGMGWAWLCMQVA